MRIRLAARVVGALILSSLSTVAFAAPPRSAVDARAVILHAARIMDTVKAVHGEGNVVMRYLKQRSEFHVTGDCNASVAKDRLGSNLQVRARTWVRGHFPVHGKILAFDAHYRLISFAATSLPRAWERSAQTKNVWKLEPYSRAGSISFAPDLCSVLFMAQVLTPGNVTQHYTDLGLTKVAGTHARFIRVTAAKPGEVSENDWYIDPVSFRVRRLRVVTGDGPPSPPNTAQSTTFTYSGFNEKVRIVAPR